MNVPGDIMYTADHEWVRRENDTAVLGITDFAQSELGDIIFIEFPEIGDSVTAGDSVGVIEAVKTVVDLYTPITGEVIEVNSTLEDRPELINKDPYSDGWVIKLKIEKSDELTGLMNANTYLNYIT